MALDPGNRLGTYEITGAIGAGVMPLWSRDGRELFWLEGSDLVGRDRMMGVKVESAASRFTFNDRLAIVDPWVYLGTFAASLRSYDVSGDGQRFLAIENSALDDRYSKAVFAQNWVEELKRLVPVE
jgi:hypothetical protein